MAALHNSAAAAAESKYIYFLLAASAAALGFALENQEPPALSLPYFLFLVCVFCWLFSFFMGLRASQVRLSALHALANAETQESALNFARSVIPEHEWAKLQSSFFDSVNSTNEALFVLSDRFEIYRSRQFVLIGIGAGSYVFWKLLPVLELIK